MAQYIDKNRVEEILRNLWKKDDGHNAEHRICYNKALQEDKFQDDMEYDYRKGMPKRDKKTKRLKHKYEIFKKKGGKNC